MSPETSPINVSSYTVPKVGFVGVGGCGTSVGSELVQTFSAQKYPDWHFLILNTDFVALDDHFNPNNEKVAERIKLGLLTVHQMGRTGHGAGMDPNVGRQAALDSVDVINTFLKKVDVVVVQSGLGKGTGTGATPVVIDMAIKAEKLVIAVPVVPDPEEGRNNRALPVLAEILGKVPTCTIHNGYLDEYMRLTMDEQESDNLIYEEGHKRINRETIVPLTAILTASIQRRGKGVRNDLADLKTMLRDRNHVFVGVYSVKKYDQEKLKPETIAAKLFVGHFQDTEIIKRGEIVDFRTAGPWKIKKAKAVRKLIKDTVCEGREYAKDSVELVHGIGYEAEDDLLWMSVLIAARDAAVPHSAGMSEFPAMTLALEPKSASEAVTIPLHPIPQPIQKNGLPAKKEERQSRHPIRFPSGGVEVNPLVPYELLTRFNKYYKHDAPVDELDKLIKDIKEVTPYEPERPQPPERKTLFGSIRDSLRPQKRLIKKESEGVS